MSPVDQGRSVLKIGIVGCGNIADNHVKSYASFDDVEITAVCDVDLARAEEFAAARGIPNAVASAGAMFDLGVDAISVCTPHPTHEAIVTEAAGRVVDVLCEKPLSIDAAAARRMIDASAARGIILSTVFQRRFWGAAVKVRQAIDSGELGVPMFGDCQVRLNRGSEYYDSAPWRGTWAADGGGVLMTQAVHYVDLLQWFMGEPVEVYAKAGNFTHGDAIEVEDTASAVITFASGAIATLGATVSASPSLGAEITLTGTSGSTIRLAEYPEGSDATLDIWATAGEKHAHSTLVETGFQPDKNVNQVNHDLELFHRLQLSDFVESVRERRRPAVTGGDAINSLLIIEAVYESARTGQPVSLAELAPSSPLKHLEQLRQAVN